MDPIIQKELIEISEELKKSADSPKDPVAKMMAVGLLHQVRKIRDEIDRLPERTVERMCALFVPKDKIDAVPSICLIQPAIRTKRDSAPHLLTDLSSFTYKLDAKRSLSFLPLYRNLILPVKETIIVDSHGVRGNDLQMVVHAPTRGQIWVGLKSDSEIESIKNVSFLIKGTKGAIPKAISVDNDNVSLSFSSSAEMEKLPLSEPFDSQQINPSFLGMLSAFRKGLSEGGDSVLVYITDPLIDRDVFKSQSFPESFRQFLEDSDLDLFSPGIFWVKFDFGSDFIVPENVEIIPNVVPVVNIAENNVTLTQSSPIAKLTKTDGSFFIAVRENSLDVIRQGFGRIKDEFTVRDFDVESYNPDILYRDIRNLYNRFADDYHAFAEYHGLKDGETLKSLREAVNRLAKAIQSGEQAPNRFDEGTYAMRNISLASDGSPVKVSYLTTFGKIGNTPSEGEFMENRKDAALLKEALIVKSAFGGDNKATPDQMYELLRYHTLTCDRLFTRMDIDAFIRMAVTKEFGPEEARRISHRISVEGTSGDRGLRRGLYIDLSFKDKKNFRKAEDSLLASRIKRQIEERSCLSMPIFVTLNEAV